MNLALRLKLLIILAAAGSTSALATTVVFNDFGPGNSYNTAQGYAVGGSGSYTGYYAVDMPFTSNGNFTLAQIDVSFVGDGPSAESPITLSLDSDNGGNPGSVLMSWTLNNFPLFGTCCTVETVTPSSTIQLSAATQYWLTAAPTNSTTSTDEAWSLNDTGATGTRKYQTAPGGPYQSASGPLSAFDVLANSPAPEPASLGIALGGLGLLAAALLRQRISRTTRT